MSDTSTEKQGFWAKLFGSIGKIDEALHEKPISRIEDVFALIGLGAVVNRTQTFMGAFLLILSYILKGGMVAWGWGETQMSDVRTMLNIWQPFSPHGRDDSLVVIAARRLFDLQHLYRWLIILGGIGVLLSLGIWLIAVASWIGYVMFVAVLVVLFFWSIMSRTIYAILGTLITSLFIGGAVLLLSYLPNAQPWLMFFAILTVIVSMAMLAVVFWPISVVARFFSKDSEGQKSLGKFIADYIVVLCWPVSLMVSAVMFNVWADIQSQMAYMTIIVILLSLGLFGIRKPGIRKVLNTMAVGNLFVYLALVAYGWIVPVDMQTSVKYQTKDYIYDAIGIYGFRTDATYYWDVNNNSRPDTVDLRYLQDGLTDSLMFPQADRRFADVNGDGQSTDADMVYFKRFMDGIGPKPVKAGWLGTLKPGVLAVVPASIPIRQQLPVQAQFVSQQPRQPVVAQFASAGGGQVAKAIPSTLGGNNFLKKFDPPIVFQNSTQWFDINLLEVEANQNYTKLVLSWSNPRTNEERVSIGEGTKIVDESGNTYQLHNSFPVKVGNWLRFYPGQTESVELFFAPVKESKSQRFQVVLPDIWNHTFTSSFNI